MHWLQYKIDLVIKYKLEPFKTHHGYIGCDSEQRTSQNKSHLQYNDW